MPSDSEALETQNVETPSMEETIQETLNEITARELDELGRFKGKDAAADAEGAAPEDTPPEAAPTETPAEDTPAPEVQIDQNQLQRLGLRKEEMAAFEKADPALKAAMLRRSDEMHRGVEQYRETAQFGQQVYKAIQPYEATIRSEGLTPDQAIASLFAVEHTLRHGTPQQKQAQIATLVQAYNVDVSSLFADGDGADPVDPKVRALEDQIARLEQQQQSWFAQIQQTEQNTIQGQIDAFAREHEYFEQVKPEVAALLQAGVAKDLSEAYDMAIFANPQIRASVLAKQQAEAEEKKRTEAAAKVAAAKQAASVNVTTRGAPPSLAPVGTMEETIRDTYRRLTS